MRKIAYFLVITNLLWTGGFFAPFEVLAHHKEDHSGGPPAETPASSNAASSSSSGGGGSGGGTPVTPPGQDKADKAQDQAQEKGEGKATEAKPKSKSPVASSPAPVAVKFEKNLERGSQGEEVRGLQSLLKQFPDIYPNGLVTGHFGQLTGDAVKKFQSGYR